MSTATSTEPGNWRRSAYTTNAVTTSTSSAIDSRLAT
ncbi:hypothetical protein SALBM217S_02859 [Streptomyces griseoloalbus]